MRRTVFAVLLAGVFAVASSASASAKVFRPGDVRVCGLSRCVSVTQSRALDALAAFYYDTARRPVRTSAPRLDVPVFTLQFANGYVSGVLTDSTPTRFLSGGVNLERFNDHLWYRVPPGLARALHAVAGSLAPLSLSAATLSANDILAPTRAGPPARPRHFATSAARGDALIWVLAFVVVAGAGDAVRRRRRRGPRARRRDGRALPPVGRSVAR